MPLKKAIERLTGRGKGQTGEVTIEFLAISMGILIPLVYLVLTIGAVQSGYFACEAAANEAARVLRNDSGAWGQSLAHRAAYMMGEDQGFSPEDMRLDFSCVQGNCADESGLDQVVVKLKVRLPAVPDFVTTNLGLAITLEAVSLVGRPEF